MFLPYPPALWCPRHCISLPFLFLPPPPPHGGRVLQLRLSSDPQSSCPSPMLPLQACTTMPGWNRVLSQCTSDFLTRCAQHDGHTVCVSTCLIHRFSIEAPLESQLTLEALSWSFLETCRKVQSPDLWRHAPGWGWGGHAGHSACLFQSILGTWGHLGVHVEPHFSCFLCPVFIISLLNCPQA